MKKLQKTTILAISFMVLMVISCMGKEEHHHNGKEGHHDAKHSMQDMNHHADKSSQSKIVVKDGIQFAFDLMTMDAHKKMMKNMKMNMKHSGSSSHVLMITLMQKEKMQLVKDATVNINITGSGGNVTSKKLMIISGGGMFHYGTDLTLDKGTYGVSAVAKIGAKTIKVVTSFEL